MRTFTTTFAALAVVCAIGMLLPQVSYAQCTTGGFTGSGSANLSVLSSSTAACQSLGTYYNWQVCAGDTYRWSTCGSGFDTQLTVRDSGNTTTYAYVDDNGPACTGTRASLDWTATIDGTVRVYMHRFSCAGADATPSTTDCAVVVGSRIGNAARSISCPSNISVGTAAPNCSAPVSYSTPTTTGACETLARIAGPASGSTFSLGTTTVTWRVTDVRGGTSSCSFTVTVSDDDAPNAVCQNVTVNLNSSGSGSLAASSVNNGSSDNCGVSSLSVSPSSFGCANVGNNTVTLTVRDAANNASTCTATVLVQDITAPTAVCQNATVTLNASGSGSTTAGAINNGSSDACGISSLSVSPSSFGCANVGNNTVTLTVRDPSNNASTCTATVLVRDITAPTAVCKNATVNLNASGSGSLAASSVNNGSSDACGVSLSVSPSSFGCANVGSNTVTLTVTDPSGNTDNCTATVTVRDVTAPNAVCQNTTVTLNASGTAGLAASAVNNGSSDACGVSLSVSPSSFTCANVGGNTVTLTVTDNNGNTATCTSTATVQDVTAPTAVCQNTTVTLNASGSGSLAASAVNNGSSDACGVSSLSVSPSSFTCANAGANTVTLTVRDPSNNASTCTATVTVQDITAPNAVCQNVTVNLNASGSGSLAASAVNNGSTDNCSVSSLSVSPSSFTCANIGANAVTLTVTDASGNTATCSATATVQDNVAPTAVCQAATVVLDASGNGGITSGDIDNGSSDACGVASLSVSPSSFTCANVGANTVTLTVTDVNGNTATCTSTATVQDNTAPTAACQNATVVLDASGNGSLAASSVNNGSSDACGIASLSVSPSSFTCANVGGNTVTLTVTDNNGNTATCSATATVQDNTAPNAVCQNATVVLDASGNGSLAAGSVNNGSSDACGIASLSVSPSSFTCANVGGNTVTLTVTDNNGNTATCTSTATVQDNTAPTASCRATYTALLDPTGNATVTTGNIDNGSSDACGVQSLSLDVTAFTCADIGNNSVVLTVTDVNGNTSTCNSVVDVVDNLPPTFNDCPTNIYQTNDAGVCGANVTWTPPSDITDNCPGFITVTPPSQTPGQYFAVGTHSIIYTARDANNNFAICNFIITVADNEPPTVVCNDLTVDLDSGGDASISLYDVFNPSSSDNCPGSVVPLFISQSNFDCDDLGNNTVTLTARDSNSNFGTCNATITVRDLIPPVITTLASNNTLECDGLPHTTDLNLWLSTHGGAAATDACNPITWSNDFVALSDDCGATGSATVTFTATDDAGNTATTSATFLIQDTTPPVFSALPANLTVECDGSGNAAELAAWLAAPMADDDCGSVDITDNFAALSDDCGATGSAAVTFTATDECGLTATASAIFTIEDTTPPTPTCPANIAQSTDPGNCGAVVSFVVGGNDACGGISAASTPLSGSVFALGTTTVNATVTDDCGNTAACSFDVTISDAEAPAALCTDLTVQLDNTGNASVTATEVDGGSTDNCGINSTIAAPASFTCVEVGANAVTLTVTDDNGNSSSCTSTVTVEDNVSPVALCQDITVQLDATGAAGMAASDVDNGSSDACGVTLSATPVSFSCAEVGGNTVTLTVTDDNGNTASCTSTVTVEDNVSPVALCQDITVQLDASGAAGIVASDVDNGSSDACGVTLSAIPVAFGCGEVGGNTVTLTVTDDNGNTSSCTSTVTVEDNVAPVALCQDITVQLDASGNAGIVAADVDNGSSDACGVTLSAAPVSFGCGEVGANAVTLTVTDVNGNTSTCTSTVTVEDNVAPVAACQAITVQLDASGAAGIVAADVDNGSSDACGVTLSATPVSFSCTEVGANTVTLTVTDDNGNSSSCSSTVTVEDNVSPVALCQDITVQLDATGAAGIAASDVDNGSSDACGVTLSAAPTAFSCAEVGSNTVTLTVTDDNGNTSSCSSTVTVEDNVAPVALCQDITVQLDASGNAGIVAADVDNGSSDACGVTLSATPVSFSCAEVGGNTVTLTVTDDNGNSSGCTSTVTVEDNVSPVALCQDITVQLDATGAAGIAASDVDNGSNDACGVTLSATPVSFSCAEVGGNTVTLTVTDANGNTASCTSTVTVEDNVEPVAVCQDITVQLDATGVATITGADIDGGSTDACGIPTLTPSQTAFGCGDIGGNTVGLTVVDSNGNDDLCLATVTVEDNVSPVAACRDITVQLDASGNAGIVAADVDNGSSDACGVTLSATPVSFSCAEVGANTVTLTVTDINGNTASCSSTVTVEDNVSPVALCQDITVQLDATGAAGIAASDVDNGSSDACGVTLSATPVSFSCAEVGANTVTLTVTDGNGNTASCSSTVTVEDNVSPVALCQDITVQLDASGAAGIVAADVDNGSSDACGVTLSATPVSFSCAEVGSNTVTLTVTDDNGNTASCSSSVTVEDNVAPVAVCQDITVQLDASGNVAINALAVNNGTSDACDGDLSVAPSTFTCSEVGAKTVTLTATDVNGNTASCTATVTVEDNVAPVAACRDITVQLDASGAAGIAAADVDNGSSDACGVTLSAAPTAFTCAEVGANAVTLTVTDDNGNTASCTSTVTVEDNVAPVALCQDLTVQLDAAGNAFVVAADIDGGSSDACGVALSTDAGLFTCAEVGANAAVLTVTDDNGNSSSCGSSILVEDSISPNAVCRDITVQLDASGNAAITAADVDLNSKDACAITLSASPTGFGCGAVGANAVVLTVTDASGNTASCGSTVTVEDTVAPLAQCDDITVQLDATGNAAIVGGDIDDGSGDACGVALSAAPAAFTCAEVGANAVTLTVTDSNGNSSSCSSTVTVEDNIAPVAVCRDITVQLDASGNASIVAADVDNGSSDACGLALSANPVSFGCSDVGANAVTLVVTDGNGNISTCASTVTVEDNIAPVAVCQDITVQLDASGNASITASDVDNGSSDACGVTLSATPTSFTCAEVGSNTVTLTVVDDNGNSSSCSSTVVVEDNIAPTAVCQDITIQLDASGNASITASDVDNGSSDACGVTLSATPTSFTCAEVGSNTVTLTVVDDNGNSSSCSSTVVVEDNVAPTAVCQDITIQLDASGNASITTTDVDNGSSDACNVTLSATPTSFTCTEVGANTVTLTVTDDNGNSSSCSSNVTVEDGDLPVALCQDITIQLDASGNASITATDVDNGSSDACNVTLSATPTSFTCTEVGANTVTLTVTDDNGNSSSCSSTVTVEDNVAPIASCQDITVQLDALGNASIVASDIDNGGADACNVTLSATPTSFTCTEVGANTVTLTVTDDNGNSSSCSSTVTVEDNVAPIASCQDITVQLDASGNASIIATDVDNGSADACGVTLSATPTAFTCAEVGVNAVTLTVTDDNGNSSSCSSTVTVEDNVAPIASCQDITVQLDASGNASITATDVDNGSADACGVTLSATPTAFTCAEVGVNAVTLTVTDGSGNTSSCSSTVTVEDNDTPTALCQDITVQLDASGNASIVAADVDNGGADACGVTLSATPTAFTCTEVGANTVTLTVTDGSGNTSSCSSTVTVEDNVEPVAVCQDITVQLDATGVAMITGADIDGGSTDACGIPTLTPSQTAFGCGDIGGNTVGLTVVDANGNDDLCLATVTVEDNIAPMAVCQDITVQLDASGNVSIVASDVDNGSSDACGVTLSATPTSFSCAEVGANTVTLTVTDDNGNSSSCSSTVTVEDNIAPTALCRQDLTVQLDASGSASIVASDIDNGSSDACGVTLSATPTSFTCAEVGSNTVTLTVTDDNGNSSSCSSTVTVEDNIAPVAVCQDLTVQLDATGSASIVASDIDNGSSDACGVTLSAMPTSFSCAEVGSNTVTLTVTDDNGNSSSCTSTVTVEDNVTPTALCQDLTVQLDATGSASIVASDVDNGSSDACGVTLSATPVSFTCAEVGSNTVTLTVTDDNGNSSGCTSTVTVEDNVTPTALCQDLTVQLDGSGAASIVASDVDNGSSDACNVSLSATPVSFTCAEVGANTVTLTVTDDNGNSSSCSSTVTVEDNIAPTALCQDLTVQLDALGAASIVAADVDNGSSDACNVSLSATPVSFTCAEVGANTVTLTVTDDNGNSSSCSSTVTVEDNIAPVAVCQDITVQLDGSGLAGIAASDVDNGSNDACGVTLSATPTAFACSDIGANTVVLTVTDDNGNSSSCSSTVTVEDNEVPLANCQDITVQLDGTGNVSISAVDVDAGSGDACGSSTLAVSPDAFDCSNTGSNTVVLTVTDGNGNSSSCNANVTVEDNILPALAGCPTDFSVCNNTPTWVSPTVSDNCPGTALQGSHNSGDVFPVGTTTVTYTATDASGNTTSCSFDVTVSDMVLDFTLSDFNGFNISCNGGDNGEAIVLVSGANSPLSYLWSNGQTDATAIGLAAGTYTVAVTDGNGCTEFATTTLTEPALLRTDAEITSDYNGSGISCFGASDGEVTATGNGGVAPYDFLWNNGVTTAVNSGLGAGTYTVTITDDNGCSNTDSVVLGSPEQLVTNPVVSSDYNGSDVSCYGAADGEATASASGGTGTLGYLWSDGQTDETATGLAAGTYGVTVTDANGCSDSGEVVVTQPMPVTINILTQTADVSCSDGADGEATVTASGGTGGLSYLWSDGQTDATATGLAPGTYGLTVTDVNGCTDTGSVNIGGPASPDVSVAATSSYNGFGVSCFGGSDGSAAVTVNDGGTYSYAWSNGASTQAVSGLSPGSYSVTVSGDLGCSTVLSVTLTRPAALGCSASGTDPDCDGGADGSLNAVAYGGVAPYTFTWSGPGGPYTGSSVSGVGTGTYNLTVNDANGCGCISTVTLTAPASIDPISSTGVVFHGGQPGGPYYYNTAQITVEGGSLPYTYDWQTSGYVRWSVVNNDDGSVTINIIYEEGADWTVVVTDQNGCGGDESLTFGNDQTASDILDIVDYAITGDTGGCTGSIDITPQGGDTSCGDYTYAWTSTVNASFAETTQDISGLCSGWYIVIVTDCIGATELATYWVPQQTGGTSGGGYTRNKVAMDDGMGLSVAPNPFVGATNVQFSLVSADEVRLEMYSIDGSLMATLFDGAAEAGEEYDVSLEGAGLAAGMYVVKLTNAKGASVHQKVTLLK